MCGIMGYVGSRPAVPIVLKGLKWLLPRGYDSGGVAVLMPDGTIRIVKDVLEDGNYDTFAQHVLELQLGPSGNATGHLRWATHGEVCQCNAHPHSDESGKISVVHNGIIENYRGLERWVREQGYTLKSETDTELVAHLFSHMMKECEGDVRKAILATVAHLEGAYSLVIQHADYPDMLIGVRMGSPLSYTRFFDGSYMFASTAEPFLEYRDYLAEKNSGWHLEDGQIVVVRNGASEVFSFDDENLDLPSVEFEGSPEDIQKEGYPFHMLKEIMTQQTRLKDVLRGRINPETGDIKLGGLETVLPRLLEMKHFFFLGSGTSYNAALILARMFRDHLNVHAEAKLASEVVSDNILAGCDPKDVVVFVLSQSGETADLIAAIKEMRKREVALVLGIVNVVGSTIARMTDAGVYLHVGPELGVASTKAFSAQVLVGAMIALLLDRRRGLSQERGYEFAQAILAIPDQIEMVLAQSELIKEIARARIIDREGVMILGRGYHYPTALEGALKIIEVGYMLREVQPAGEMKHGPIAIINPGFPVLIVATNDYLREHIFSNVSELKARGAYIVGICTNGDSAMASHVHSSVLIPDAPPELATLLATAVLQLFAYHIGVLRGNNVDMPKNLAKAVTVL